VSELRTARGELVARRTTPWRRLRRPLLLLAVTLLCGAFYLAGIWSGMHGRMTCVESNPGVMVCSSGDDAPAVPRPAPAATKTGSA
jgi:hypothetical protein